MIEEFETKDDLFPSSRRSTNTDTLLQNHQKKFTMFGNEYRRSRKLSRYNNALKNLIPIRINKTSNEEMGIDSAGFFSTISFSWITKYLWIAYRKGITFSDLPKPSPYDTAHHNAKRLEALWNEEVMRHSLAGASFSRAAWKFIRTRIFIASLMFGFAAILGFLGPAIVMRMLLQYIESPEGSAYTGVMWIFLLIISDVIRVTFFSWGWSACYRTGLRMKSAYIAVMYRKLIKTNDLGNKHSGKFINMMANDGQSVFDLCIFTPMMIAGPIVAILIIIYILFVLSPMALLGFMFFFSFYPLQYLISRLIGYFKRRSITVSDQRISAVNEILNCIKLIKMYAWEDPFCANLLDLRKKERSWLEKMCITRSYGSSLTTTIPIVAGIITFLVHVAGGYNLTAAQAFPILAIFVNQMRNSLSSFREGPRHIIESQISFDRMKSVLTMQESNCFIQKPIVKNQTISIINGSFACDFDLSEMKSDKEKKTIKNTMEQQKLEELEDELESLMPKRIEVLKDITFEATKSQLIGICGHVGSGKSCLLKAALGQLRMTGGKISREGSCAYVSQQAWVLNATFKENILFGNPFDAQRYYAAIALCCLQDDLDVLPAADETEIGERGINLSGGQKQRVSLARAYYANKDIYFLDDPLSAVDANVGWYIFENLIQGALKNKSVIFVTHQISYLSRCNQIYMMNNSRIVEHGDHASLIKAGKDYASMARSTIANRNSSYLDEDTYDSFLEDKQDHSGQFDKNADDYRGENAGEKEENENDGTLIEAESMEKGSIKADTYLMYIDAMGGFFVSILVAMNILLTTSCIFFSNWWLAHWIKAGSGGTIINMNNETTVSENIIDNPNLVYYQTIYGSCILAILASSLLRGFVLTRTTLVASTTLHNKLFKKVINATLQFFETTPKGRLQNLFSRDISELDSQLPIVLENVLNSILHGILNVLIVCIILPYSTIAFIVLSGLFYLVTKIFRKSLRDLQRHESTSRSPIFSHATATLQGLETIHAFEKESEFIKQFYEYIDVNGTCNFLSNVLLRWAAVRFDILTVIAYACTGFIVVFMKGFVSPAMAGLALSFCGQMTGFLQFTIRSVSQTELKFISVERIGLYTNSLKDEDDNTKKSAVEIQDKWPQNGVIEFKDVALKYRKNTPIVLSGVSFRILPGEKLGIAGRTGSGKSSLVVALFRLVELLEGRIEIDGVDISTIDLKRLRSKLSIIPQDPVIFSGTIRFNLDPLKLQTDDELWMVLERTKLKDKVLSMPGRLSAVIDSGGSNLSMGERQLLCLARALLRANKILILDEATAAVDPQTEAIVQKTIKEEFSNCTILTIAHRLQTILSCDRIIVMEAGKIVEFDTPRNLLENENSEFSKMLNATEKGQNTR